MTVPYAPPTPDLKQAVDELHRLSRHLIDDLAVTFTHAADLPPGLGFDYDGTTRTLRVRHDATMPKILRAMQECWRLIVLGPEHTTATCRSHLHLVTPRQPMD